MNSPQTEAALIMPQTGQSFPLDQDLITIGRKAGNTIVLEDDLKTSRYHASITWEAGRYIIEDAGSSNGTYLNGERITEPEPLSAGDIIQIGDTTFTVQLPSDETEPTMLRSAPETEEIEETIVSSSALDLDDTLVRGPKPPGLENPYVGPRTFTQEESDRFFGREPEARELLSLIISERLVLFYAQSGAGKSSLINARLIPRLRGSGYAVLPVGRVSGELPEGIPEVDNIYVFNLLLSLDESDGDPNRFVRMGLSEFLARLTSYDGRHYYYDDEFVDDVQDDELYEESPYILILDQFEEIVTAHPGHWQEREDFFRQLDRAMTEDPYLWVVLTIREDYVAALDPYVHLLPGHLRARFHMQRMSHEAALEAVKKPAERFERPFAPGAAEQLVDNLRQIRVHSVYAPDQIQTQLGQFVEPVQLQVVCYQLWENLQNRPAGEITRQDLEELGDVDTALVEFYEQALREVIEQTEVSEIDLRNWFETQLITEAGTRGTVYRGAEQTGDLPNEAVDLLVDKFLLRAEARTGGTWYELVHDRFINPILQANRAWGLRQPLVQMAQDWDESGRSLNKLLEGQPLQEALAGNWRGLGPLVEEFLEASQAAQEVKERAERAEKEAQRQRELEQAQALAEEQRKRAEEQAQSAASLRRRAFWIAGVGVIAVLLALAAGALAMLANRTATEAQAAQETAQAESIAAEANAAEARRLLQSLQATPTVSTEPTAESAEEELELQADDLEAVLTAQAMAAVETATAATAEAVAAAATSESTPTPSSSAGVTPTGPYTPTPEDSPTPTETVTPDPSPTPNMGATATIQAIEIELASVRATQTTVAQRNAETPPASDSASCKIEPQGELRPVWERFRERLGCPVQAEPVGGFFAEQPFENGHMFWSQILDVFIVTIGDDRGTWQLIPNDAITSLDPSGTPCDPEGEPSSPDLVAPIRGFGGIWCDFPEIRQDIGYGLVSEYGVSENLLQPYQDGAILKASNGAIYILFGDEDGGTYIRERR